jgi:hypothetical protein
LIGFEEGGSKCGVVPVKVDYEGTVACGATLEEHDPRLGPDHQYGAGVGR